VRSGVRRCRSRLSHPVVQEVAAPTVRSRSAPPVRPRLWRGLGIVGRSRRTGATPPPRRRPTWRDPVVTSGAGRSSGRGPEVGEARCAGLVRHARGARGEADGVVPPAQEKQIEELELVEVGVSVRYGHRRSLAAVPRQAARVLGRLAGASGALPRAARHARPVRMGTGARLEPSGSSRRRARPRVVLDQADHRHEVVGPPRRRLLPVEIADAGHPKGPGIGESEESEGTSA